MRCISRYALGVCLAGHNQLPFTKGTKALPQHALALRTPENKNKVRLTLRTPTQEKRDKVRLTLRTTSCLTDHEPLPFTKGTKARD